jgi:hypothetical protein
LVGWGVIATGVVSAATLSRAAIAFSRELFPVPTYIGITFVVVILTAIAVRGILESVWFAAVITVIEVGGLFWVLGANAGSLTELGGRFTEMLPGMAWNE